MKLRGYVVSGSGFRSNCQERRQHVACHKGENEDHLSQQTWWHTPPACSSGLRCWELGLGLRRTKSQEPSAYGPMPGATAGHMVLTTVTRLCLCEGRRKNERKRKMPQLYIVAFCIDRLRCLLVPLFAGLRYRWPGRSPQVESMFRRNNFAMGGRLPEIALMHLDSAFNIK